MRKVTGAWPRSLIIWGVLALIILSEIYVVHATEATPVSLYFDSLEGSIFAHVADADYLENTHPHIAEKMAFYIRFFNTEGHTSFQQWLDQAGPYMPLIKGILREEGIPEDLAFLPLIESGFDTEARSPAEAMGLWQFMASTGAFYGLKVNRWVDERKDPVKSTRAAARHLKELYNTFGTWPLALASYNGGRGKVKRALASTGFSTFWDIARGRKLKAETRNYIPKFAAALIIAKNPDAFGFTFSEGSTVGHDVLQVPGGMDLRTIAKNADISHDALRKLNPELKSDITPFMESYYSLRLQEGAGSTFLENFYKLPPSQRIVYREHRVKKGDTVYKIVRQYGSSARLIKKVNHLNKSYKIINGEFILVPVNMPAGEDNVRLITAPDLYHDTL